MSLEKLPDFSKDLIRELSKCFPDAYAVPNFGLPDRKIWIRVGERRVVTMLERLLEDSQKHDPTQKVLAKE